MPAFEKRAAAPPQEATRTFVHSGPLALESGAVLPRAQLAFRTFGKLSPGGDNAVVVCHALTGSADVERFWPGLLGPGRALDPEQDFIVCANVLGSPYGSTSPLSLDPETGRAYGPRFPAVTIRDMVRIQVELVRSLGVRRVRLVLGGSSGGMQVLEWALLAPDLVQAIAPIAACAKQTAWGIGLNEAQRAAIAADPAWRGGHYPPGDPPRAGLAAARMLAMCTYRSRASFEARFGRQEQSGGFAVASYLRHHGRKLVERFDANCYLALLAAVDSHDVGRGRGGWQRALSQIRCPALVVSVDTDVLYPPEDQQEMARAMPRAQLTTLASIQGHDGFLIETSQLNALLLGFRARWQLNLLENPCARTRLSACP